MNFPPVFRANKRKTFIGFILIALIFLLSTRADELRAQGGEEEIVNDWAPVCRLNTEQMYPGFNPAVKGVDKTTNVLAGCSWALTHSRSEKWLNTPLASGMRANAFRVVFDGLLADEDAAVIVVSVMWEDEFGIQVKNFEVSLTGGWGTYDISGFMSRWGYINKATIYVKNDYILDSKVYLDNIQIIATTAPTPTPSPTATTTPSRTATPTATTSPTPIPTICSDEEEISDWVTVWTGNKYLDGDFTGDDWLAVQVPDPGRHPYWLHAFNETIDQSKPNSGPLKLRTNKSGPNLPDACTVDLSNGYQNTGCSWLHMSAQGRGKLWITSFQVKYRFENTCTTPVPTSPPNNATSTATPSTTPTALSDLELTATAVARGTGTAEAGNGNATATAAAGNGNATATARAGTVGADGTATAEAANGNATATARASAVAGGKDPLPPKECTNYAWACSPSSGGGKVCNYSGMEPDPNCEEYTNGIGETFWRCEPGYVPPDNLCKAPGGGGDDGGGGGVKPPPDPPPVKFCECSFENYRKTAKNLLWPFNHIAGYVIDILCAITEFYDMVNLRFGCIFTYIQNVFSWLWSDGGRVISWSAGYVSTLAKNSPVMMSTVVTPVIGFVSYKIDDMVWQVGEIVETGTTALAKRSNSVSWMMRSYTKYAITTVSFVIRSAARFVIGAFMSVMGFIAAYFGIIAAVVAGVLLGVVIWLLVFAPELAAPLVAMLPQFVLDFLFGAYLGILIFRVALTDAAVWGINTLWKVAWRIAKLLWRLRNVGNTLDYLRELLNQTVGDFGSTFLENLTVSIWTLINMIGPLFDQLMAVLRWLWPLIMFVNPVLGLLYGAVAWAWGFQAFIQAMISSLVDLMLWGFTNPLMLYEYLTRLLPLLVDVFLIQLNSFLEWLTFWQKWAVPWLTANLPNPRLMLMPISLIPALLMKIPPLVLGIFELVWGSVKLAWLIINAMFDGIRLAFSVPDGLIILPVCTAHPDPWCAFYAGIGALNEVTAETIFLPLFMVGMIVTTIYVIWRNLVELFSVL